MFKSFTISILITYSLLNTNNSLAQEAARIIEAYANRCPLTAGGPHIESYYKVIESLRREAEVEVYQRQITNLNSELKNPLTTHERQIQNQNEIADLQAQINSIEMQIRISANQSRLSAFNYVSTASSALLNAIGSLMGEVVSYFRDRNIRETSADLERSFSPTAVRCAYLSIGEQFCRTSNIRDTVTYAGIDPWSLVNHDRAGRCDLYGFRLTELNIQSANGLATSVGRIATVLNNAVAGPGSSSDLDQFLFGGTNGNGLYSRIQQIDNYNFYVSDSLNHYKDNVYDNFDPRTNTAPFVTELHTSINAFMTSSSGPAQLEDSLQHVVDMHREALGIRWANELNDLIPASKAPARSEIVRYRQQLRNRLRTLTSLGNNEVTRIAAIGQLTRNIQEASRTFTEMNASDPSRSAVRDRLRGLCESTLMLPYAQINDTYKSTCGDIIYRNEGNSNVRFNEMYTRMRRDAPFSTSIACHQFNVPDNVGRDSWGAE